MKAATRRVVGKSTVLTIVCLGAVICGCAPMPEVKQEARDYRNLDHENQFIAYRRQCVANGGKVMILANGDVDRRGIPSRGTYYTCA